MRAMLKDRSLINTHAWALCEINFLMRSQRKNAFMRQNSKHSMVAACIYLSFGCSVAILSPSTFR